MPTHLSTANIPLRLKLEEVDVALDALEAARTVLEASVASLETQVFGTTDVKASVRIASTANRALTGLAAIDGVTPVAGDRVLLKNQTAGAENGIYVAAAGAWSRATDANASSEVTAGLSVFVSEGTANGNTVWDLTTDDPITLGTTALVFTSRALDAAAVSTIAAAGFVVDNATNNNLTTVLRLRHTTSGAPAAFIGTSIELETESAGGTVTAARVSAYLSDVTAGAEIGAWRVSIMGNPAGTVPALGSEQISCSALGLFILTAENPIHRLNASGSGGIEVNTTGTGGQSYVSCTGDTGKALFLIMNDSARASTLCGLNNADLAVVLANGTPSNTLIAATSDLYLSGNTTTVGLRVTTANSVAVGPAGALATTAVAGFLYVSGGAGPPTGVPTAITGKYAVYWNSTDKKLYVYDGAWLGGTAPGVFS